MRFFKDEINHFRLLPKKSRELLVLIFLYSSAYPIISVYINSYIWKNSVSPYNLPVFRLGLFLTVPVFFALTGILVKKIKVGILYFIGAIIISLSAITVIFLKNNSFLSYLTMGVCLGAGAGLYWANRNYITQKETDEKNRNYFFGLSLSYQTFVNLMITSLIGWLIVFGLSYEFIFSIAFVLIFLSGYRVYINKHENPTIKSIFVKNPSLLWQRKRLLYCGIGLIDGLTFFIPSILILKYLGGEGILGTLTAISSLFSSFLMYLYGRNSNVDNNKKTLIFSLIAVLSFSFIMMAFFNKMTILMYILISGLTINFVWLTMMPIAMRVVDKDTVSKKESAFIYVIDTEAFLNIGRVMSLSIYIFVLFGYGEDMALRMVPFISSLMQSIMYFFLF